MCRTLGGKIPLDGSKELCELNADQAASLLSFLVLLSFRRRKNTHWKLRHAATENRPEGWDQQLKSNLEMLFWAVGAVRAVKENVFNFIKYISLF